MSSEWPTVAGDEEVLTSEEEAMIAESRAAYERGEYVSDAELSRLIDHRGV